MISDSLDNLSKYKGLVPHIKEIANYINKNSLVSLKGGKYDIVDDSAFILIQEYLTKPVNEKFWESHKKYIDIQVVLEGQEYMGYSPIGTLEIKDPYNEGNDIIFYNNDSVERGNIMVHKNHFCVFFPEDAHKPGLHIIEAHKVKKAVIKVVVE